MSKKSFFRFLIAIAIICLSLLWPIEKLWLRSKTVKEYAHVNFYQKNLQNFAFAIDFKKFHEKWWNSHERALALERSTIPIICFRSIKFLSEKQVIHGECLYYQFPQQRVLLNNLRHPPERKLLGKLWVAEEQNLHFNKDEQSSIYQNDNKIDGIGFINFKMEMGDSYQHTFNINGEYFLEGTNTRIPFELNFPLYNIKKGFGSEGKNAILISSRINKKFSRDISAGPFPGIWIFPVNSINLLANTIREKNSKVRGKILKGPIQAFGKVFDAPTLCHDVDGQCRNVLPFTCDHCPFGWFEVPSTTCPGEGRKYCGVDKCGEKNHWACVRGQLERGLCFDQTSSGICQKELAIKCQENTHLVWCSSEKDL